jgi:Tfp pilus assembly PilM family ATPase
MLKSSPNDVLVLDSDALALARFSSSKKSLELLQLQTTRLNAAFAPAAVTPTLENRSVLVEAARRLRSDAGSIERVSLLLPDSWFRMNLIEIEDLPERRSEADEVIRWSLKRTLPIPADELRLAYTVVGRTNGKPRVLVISAIEKTLAAIESAMQEAGVFPVVIEPLGLNLWNAITVREATTTRDRLLLHIREQEFTTAVFRGGEPIFLRSRNLGGDRNISQEIRLSASYLRDNLRLDALERCYVAGADIDAEVLRIVAEEFGAPVTRVTMRDYLALSPGLETLRLESEVIACSGVFAA